MRPERRRTAVAATTAVGMVLCVAHGAVADEPAPGLDLDASVRLRYESADEAFLGPPVSDTSHVLLTRALASLAAYAPQGSGLYLQVGWHDELGREPRPAPTDVDGLDVQQAYADLRVGATTQLRLGRQELVLGSARLVGVRESPNIRRSFDGATLSLRSGPWNVRLLALAAVTNARGAFDDRTDRAVRLEGVYATRDPGDGLGGVDAYALHSRNGRAQYAIGSGVERRWSFGVRLFDTRAALDYNVEAVVQTGSFTAYRIRAWTIASDTGYTLRGVRFTPRLGLKANITSGDRDPRDGRLGTFNPLFPNLAYFSEAATIAPQNHADLQLSATLQPAAGWTVRIGADRFWRTTANDAVYRANGAPYVVAGRDRDVASQVTLDVSWRVRPALETKASIAHWRPADALERAGARSTWFAMVSLVARL